MIETAVAVNSTSTCRSRLGSNIIIIGFRSIQCRQFTVTSPQFSPDSALYIQSSPPGDWVLPVAPAITQLPEGSVIPGRVAVPAAAHRRAFRARAESTAGERQRDSGGAKESTLAQHPTGTVGTMTNPANGLDRTTEAVQSGDTPRAIGRSLE